jgi:hypothetical protein
MRPDYGETWVYESIVGALPGVDLSRGWAVLIQVGLFEAAVLALAWYYNLWSAVVPGTVAVLVAGAGSALMLRIARLVRGADTPVAYRRLLFGSSIEVVLGVLAFVALVTYLFVVDSSLVRALFGADPPAVAVSLTLLVLWDLVYRIGVAWWAAVTGLWRSARYRFDRPTARRLRRADAETLAFGLLQLALVPFVVGQPVLLAALLGHVVAVLVVTTLSIALLWSREKEATASPSVA